MINVTKSFLPPIEEYHHYLSKIWDKSILTNRGPLLKELEHQLMEKLGVENLLFVSNGTIALQLAIKALQLKGEVITTPFSYVATTTSVIWENCTPVFADIEKYSLCISPEEIEKHINPNTCAIIATHVYGNACDVVKIEEIAVKYNLKVIYDGAHAFGININGTSLLNYGDVSTISFHATKVFHTVEGGAVITKDKRLAEKLYLLRSFGHINDDYYTVGINGNNSEFHAAMGLCNLKHINEIKQKRSEIVLKYKSLLCGSKLSYPEKRCGQNENYSYFPVVFESEEILFNVKKRLHENHINTRRYFYPSLNNLHYLKSRNDCPVAENISCRILCLPLYADLGSEDVERICQIVNSSL